MNKAQRHLLIRAGLVALVASALGCGTGNIGDVLPADASAADSATLPCPDPQTWYRDQDGDGFGDPNSPLEACESVPGYVSDSSDCDDDDPAVNPDAVEICGDEIDNDCSGSDACAASLVAHWSFKDGQGVTARDASGKGHDGTLRNNPAWSADGEYLTFINAQETYVEVPHTPAFLLDEGTVAFWYNSSSSSSRGLWSKDASGLGTGGHLTITTQSASDPNPRRIQVRLQDLDGDHYVYSTAISTNRWYHVAFTFGPGGMKLYLDGQSSDVGTNSYSGGLGPIEGKAGNLEPIVIGASSTSSESEKATPTTSWLAGAMHSVQLYDRKLTGQEIGELIEVTRLP